MRYITEIAKNNLNVSITAKRLLASQPGISKQIKLFEEEIGTEVFIRNGKHLVGLTDVGQQIVRLSQDILHKLHNLKQIALEAQDMHKGTLHIATTHMQACYALPKTVISFTQHFPQVSLQLNQGHPIEIARMVVDGTVDFAIATEALDDFDELVTFNSYSWHHGIIIKPDHPLKQTQPLSLFELAQYPIVTYTHGFTGRKKLDTCFAEQGIEPYIVFTAADSDVIKTYVRLGLGVGIITEMAYQKADEDLVYLDAKHLFPASTTKIAIKRHSYLRNYAYKFIEIFAPHLTKEVIDKQL